MNETPNPNLRSHRGVLILVFGILGLVVCFPFGIAAWLMGGRDLRDMDAGRMDPSGRGMTQAGRIVGIVATVLALIGLIIGITIFALSILSAAASV